MTHGAAKLVLAAVLLAFIAPIAVRGHVLFAHDNALHVGLQPGPGISNYKFDDQSNIYLPQTHHQLAVESAGWISTWNPYPELGRPAWHVSGLSKAWILFHALSWFVQDARVMLTLLALAALIVIAVCGYGFLAESGLHPAACLTGALGLSLGTFSVYWLSFVMFLWTIAWTLACLWAVRRLARKPELGWGLFLAFSVHALLLTGYPQQIVWSAWLLIGFTLHCLLRGKADAGQRVRRLGVVAGWTALGLACAAPVYLDLALNAGRSARAAIEPEFFLRVLPTIEDVGDLLLYGARRVDAFLQGNPIRPDYPARFDGLSLTPLFTALLALSFATGQARRLWPAWMFVGLGLLATLWSPAYVFGIRYLGLDVSRFLPLAGVWIPVFVLGAYAADRVLAALVVRRALLVGLTLLPLLATAVVAGYDAQAWQASWAIASVVVTLLGVAFVVTRKSWVLASAAAVTTLGFAYPLVISRPAEDVKLDSPMVQSLRQLSAPDARFAFVAPPQPGGQSPTRAALPPNQETLFGLSSIHTYNSLSSRAYQDWILRLSPVGAAEHGRHFQSLVASPLLASNELSWSGVGVLVSVVPLDPGHFVELGPNLYRPRVKPLRQAQLVGFERRSTDGNGAGGEHDQVRVGGKLDEVAETSGVATRRTQDISDHLIFEVTPHPDETLLFVSQEFHPQWHARSAELDGAALETVVVNGFYQGVIVPPNTRSVELSFDPLVRWAWLPQALFALAGIALVARRVIAAG